MAVNIPLATLERVEIQATFAGEARRLEKINPDFDTSNRAAVVEGEPGRRLGFAAVAFLVWAMSVALIAVIPALFLLPYLASVDISISDTARIVEVAKNDQTAVFLQIAAIIPAHALTLLLAYLVVSQFRRYRFLGTLGWQTGGIRWWHYCIILGAFFAVAAVVGYFLPEQDNDLLRVLRSSRYAVYIVAIIATFSAPLIEEVIYRGVLYSGFQRAFGVPAAFVLVTILFALVHVPQYYPSASTIILLTLLSITLTSLRVYSNNLLPCVVLHTIFNGIQSLMLLLEPLLTNPPVIESVPAVIVGFK